MTATLSAPATVPTISPERLKELIQSGDAIELIDVRTPVEYRGKRVTAARNVPLNTLSAEALRAERVGREAQPLYVVCQSGGRARKACETLISAGVNAICVEGGTPACEQVGVPVTRGQQTISLERQVRIAAGALVALGAALSALVSPWFLIVPGFVGCGLVFAGMTDYCGMGLLLAKMPWNR